MNAFDQLDGMSLEGFSFKKLKKAVKKVGNSIKKSVKANVRVLTKTPKALVNVVKTTVKNPLDIKAIAKAGEKALTPAKDALKANLRVAETVVTGTRDVTLPPRIAKELQRAGQNPIVKAVAVAVVGLVAGPVVGAILSKLGFATTIGTTAVNAKTIAVTAAKAAAKGVLKQEIGKYATRKLAPGAKILPPTIKPSAAVMADPEIRAQVNALINSTATVAEKNSLIDQLNKAFEITPERAAQSIANMVNELSSNEGMRQAVIEQIKAGKTPEQIVSEWKNSENFQAAASAVGADAVYDYLLKYTIATGVPPKDAPAVAQELSLDVGKSAAEKVSGREDITKMIAIGAPILFAILGG